MKTQTKAYLYALSAILCWSTVATAFKISLRSLDFLQLLLYSSLVSTLTLFVIICGQGKLPELRRNSRCDLIHSAVLGFLNPFFYYVVLFKAYSILPAQEAQPLNYTWPIMLVILSIPLLRQAIRLIDIVALCISFCGVLIISTHGDLLGFKFSNPFGVFLAVGSSVIWALFWIYNVRDTRDELIKLFWNFVFGSIFILAATAVFSSIPVDGWAGICGAAYVGIFEMGLTFVFWLKAITYSRTTAQVSNLIFISPFLSLFPIHFIVGEKILPSTVIGLIFIIGGIAVRRWAETTTRRSGLPSSPEQQ